MEELLNDMKIAAVKAGNIACNTHDINKHFKSDGTIVSNADIASNEYLCKFFADNYSKLPLLSEENEDDPKRLDEREVLIIDPLDGSSDFPANKDASILIALVRDGTPKLGVVYLPMRGILFSSGPEQGFSLEYDPKIDHGMLTYSTSLNELPHVNNATELIIGSSVRDGETKQRMYEFLNIPADRRVSSGGMGARMMDMALGKTNLVISNPLEVKEWDVAAGHAILESLGFSVTDVYGNAIYYNKPKPIFDRGIMATNKILKKQVMYKYEMFLRQ